MSKVKLFLALVDDLKTLADSVQAVADAIGSNESKEDIKPDCTPSARLELEFDDSSGEAALEGTAAHNLSEHKLRLALNIKSKRPVSSYDSKEMK